MTLVPRFLRTVVCMILLLSIPSLVLAELSFAEKQQVVNQISAMNLLASASQEMIGHLELHCGEFDPFSRSR